MKKSNVSKIEVMMSDFLQYRFKIYLGMKELRKNEDGNNADFIYYQGACAMIESCGGTWRRYYNGKEDNLDDLNNPEMYSHVVMLPSDETCARLNIDAWK